MKSDEHHPGVKVDEHYPDVKADEHHPDVEVNEHYPGLEADEHHPDVEVNEHHPDVKVDEHHPDMEVNEHHPDVKVGEHRTDTNISEHCRGIDDDTSNGLARATSVPNSPSPKLDARQSEVKPEPIHPPLEQDTSSHANLAESLTELTRPEISPTTSSEDAQQTEVPSRAQPAASREECAVKNCGAVSDIFWCSICDTVLCNSCWSKQVAHQDKGGREKHLQNELRFKTVLSSLFVSGACVENDESKFKWFEVNAEGHITTTHRYTELSVDAWLDRPRYPALLSFVGGPGAGKSTLIKALMKVTINGPSVCSIADAIAVEERGTQDSNPGDSNNNNGSLRTPRSLLIR